MLKNYCHISNQHPPNCLIAKFHAKIRILKFGNKNALFGCFGQQFWKTIVIFEISTLEFSLLESFVQKKKSIKFGTKNARSLYFGAGIWKYYCHIWNQHPQTFLIAKFRQKKQKCLNSGPKMPYLGVFGLDFSKNYFHIWNQYPWTCLIAK